MEETCQEACKLPKTLGLVCFAIVLCLFLVLFFTFSGTFHPGRREEWVKLLLELSEWAFISSVFCWRKKSEVAGECLPNPKLCEIACSLGPIFREMGEGGRGILCIESEYVTQNLRQLIWFFSGFYCSVFSEPTRWVLVCISVKYCSFWINMASVMMYIWFMI